MVSSLKQGCFFSVDLEIIKKNVISGGMAEEIFAYIILARHINARAKSPCSTAGANAVANKAGITYRKAEKALAWLSTIRDIPCEIESFISTPIENPGLPDKSKDKRLIVRWLLYKRSSPTLLYLANSLVDGIGAGKEVPPLMRIMNQTGIASGISVHKARLDSIMLLLTMYLYHEIADCGGVDPRVGLFREWNNAKPMEEIYYDGLPILLQEIQDGKPTVYIKFANKSLFYVADDEERMKRFWHAFDSLKKLGFVYEVLHIWDENPHENTRAEPLYPLYIFDRHARDNEPFLAYEIHKLLINDGIIDGAYIDDFFNLIRENRNNNEKQFRYIMPSEGGYPLSVYRLRFRPKTRDNFLGIEQEERRSKNWLGLFEKDFCE